MPFESKTIKEVTAFMTEARERHAYALAADALDRKEAVDDVAFAAASPQEGGGSTQWDPKAIKQRLAAKRPILTENRLPTFIAQVVNDGRQSKPAIKITPLDGGNPKTAEVLQSRIRHIEYESDADIVYDTARKHQVTSGRGFLRVTTRYKDNHKSNEQEPHLERISNQFAVLFGPAKEYDCSDADFCFVTTNISKDEHKRRFGAETTAARSNFFANGECPAPEWFNTGKAGLEVQICEYWLKIHKNRKRVQLKDSTETRWQDEAAPELVDESVEAWDADDVKVYQYILDGAEPLDETEWLVPYIGIVPQWGDEQVVDGVRRTYSLIRNAKDPQRLINRYVSNIAEAVALAPKNPYRAPFGAIDGFEDIWENLNNEARSVAPYNQYDADGREIRPPEREQAEPPIQALVVGYNQAVDALKASMGIFDPSLGAQSNEVSSLAIESRKKESDNANFHFHDNEARTRRTVGRILLALLKVLDTGEKTVPIRTEDGKTKTVRINTPQPYRDDQTGEMVHHVLAEGDYSAGVSTGPSYLSQREQAFDTYSKIATADKNFMTLAGDILFANLDAPGSEEIAERYRMALPPALQAKKGQQQQIPPQVQQMLQQGKQTMMQQSQAIQKLQQMLESKQPEVQARIQIAQMQEDTKRRQIEAEIRIAELNAGVKSAIARLENEVDAIQHGLNLDQEQTQASQQQTHEQALASGQQDHEKDLQTSQQDADRQSQQQQLDAQQQADVQPAPDSQQQPQQ